MTAPGLPFNAARLDAALDAMGIDALLATSRHNLRYLLGGYECQAFRHIDALGSSRYTPTLGYWPGVKASFYLGTEFDSEQLTGEPIWVEDVRTQRVLPSDVAGQQAAAALRHLDPHLRVVGIEFPFASADFVDQLRARLPEVRFVDVTPALEWLRAVKMPHELAALERATTQVVDAMHEVFGRLRAGQLVETIGEVFREAAALRGLEFNYCFVIGSNVDIVGRASRIRPGSIVNVDSGARHSGYLTDVARNGVLGEPSDAHVRALRKVDVVQSAAKAAVKAGLAADDIMTAAQSAIADVVEVRWQLEFTVHGTGLVANEAPRSPWTGGSESFGSGRLEPGMVLSLETVLTSPDLGLVKLEDVGVVDQAGWHEFAGASRGWNCA